MKLLLQEVKGLEENELKRCNDQYPLFISNHEGYAVILEEFEETMVEYIQGKEILEELWKAVKGNEPTIAHSKALENAMLNLASEAIQTAAMCKKFRLSQGCEV